MSGATLTGVGAPPRIKGREMVPVSFAHGCTDLCQGAVPALLPFLIASRGLNLATATALVTAATIASAVVQPLFGIWADRLDFPLLAPIGVIVAGLGLGAVGFCHSFEALAAALVVSGLGVALFHPEAARIAGRVGQGTARGMSYFSVGGNVGFAVGPLAVLATVGIFGLSASPLLALPGLIAGAVLLLELRDPSAESRREAAKHQGAAPHPPSRWGPFARLSGAAVARTVAFFALQAFVPLYLIEQHGTSKAVAGIALTLMLATGAIGTLVGSRWADRWGKRLVLIWAMVPLTVILAVFPELNLVGCFIALAGIGFLVDSPFATTVVIGQSYLPGRAGLASGVTLGLAIGLGGLIAAALGILADKTSITTALFTLPAFSIIGMVLAVSLPDD